MPFIRSFLKWKLLLLLTKANNQHNMTHHTHKQDTSFPFSGFPSQASSANKQKLMINVNEAFPSYLLGLQKLCFSHSTILCKRKPLQLDAAVPGTENST